jgi:hypothetical protein
MKLTVSKSHVDKEGRVMAVTMPMPEIPTPHHWETESQFSKRMIAYDKTIQQVKDTSVVYEDQKAAKELIMGPFRKKMDEERKQVGGEFTCYSLMGNTFYDHDTVEVEIVTKWCDRSTGSCHRCEYIQGTHGDQDCKHSTHKVARILPIVEKPVETQSEVDKLKKALDECAYRMSVHYPDPKKMSFNDWENVLNKANSLLDRKYSIKIVEKPEQSTITVPLSMIPKCSKLIEAYETDHSIIVMYGPGEEIPEYHDCDEMGCGSFSHVKYRLTLPSPPKP